MADLQQVDPDVFSSVVDMFLGQKWAPIINCADLSIWCGSLMGFSQPSCRWGLCPPSLTCWISQEMLWVGVPMPLGTPSGAVWWCGASLCMMSVISSFKPSYHKTCLWSGHMIPCATLWATWCSVESDQCCGTKSFGCHDCEWGNTDYRLQWFKSVTTFREQNMSSGLSCCSLIASCSPL